MEIRKFRMTPTGMASAIGGLRECEGSTVVSTLPKFKMEYKVENAKCLLRQLGVEKIFEASEGDFGSMFVNKVGRLSGAH